MAIKSVVVDEANLDNLAVSVLNERDYMLLRCVSVHTQNINDGCEWTMFFAAWMKSF